MNWARNCVVIIPCLNEASSIASVVRSARQHLPEVIVVDDGSMDDTARLACVSGAGVIRHPTNRGKGASVDAGCQSALERSFTWALLMDGDGQHAPADIPKFLAHATETGADLIVGNRFHGSPPHEMPSLRRWVNCWMSRQLSKRTGRELPDSQCGFRLVRLEAWQKVNLKTRSFEIESEMLVKFIDAGRTVEFVPIEVIYKKHSSTIHPLRDTVRWLKWWSSNAK